MAPDSSRGTTEPRPVAAAEATSVATQTFRTVKELWDDQVRTRPDKVVFYLAPTRATVRHHGRHPRQGNDDRTCFETYTYGQVDVLAQRIAKQYARHVAPRVAGDDVAVIAFLISDSFDVLLNQIAVLKLGHASAFFSPDSSNASLEHLLQSTAAKTLFHDAQRAVLAHKTAEQLKSRGFASPLVAPIAFVGRDEQPASSSSLASAKLDDDDDEGQDARPTVGEAATATEADGQDCAMILHSSGSTGLPMPIRLSHQTQAALFTLERVSSTFHTLPLFHHFGQISLWRCIASGSKVVMAYGSLNAADLTAMMEASGALWLFGVPLLLKLLSEHQPAVEALAKFERIIVGGSACPTEIGNELVRRGVRLVVLYGASEFGTMATSVRHFDRDRDWDYLRILPAAAPFAYFDLVEGAEATGTEADGALYELCVKRGWLGLANVTFQGGVYRSKDLFRRHSTRPDAFRSVGRLDDTLVHFNGKKTNPLPIELMIRSSPLVDNCVVFGADRALAGVLIVPSRTALAAIGETTPDGDASASQEALRHALWQAMVPVVERAHRDAPSHSRIVPELIRVLPVGSRFPSSDKGSLIRAKTIAEYADEIERAYDDYEHGRASLPNPMAVGRLDLPPHHDWLATVEAVVRLFLDIPAGNGAEALDVDLVVRGMDSLTASRIRNKLQRGIPDTGLKPLPSNVVYDHPTIRKLASFLTNRDDMKDGANGSTASTTEQRKSDRAAEELEETKMMVDTLRARILPRRALEAGAAEEDAGSASKVDESHPTAATVGRVVVLTGATGSLGAHLVYQLSRRPGVRRVVCLNRASSDADARKRLDESLAVRKLPSVEALRQSASGETVVIDCFAADLTDDRLGLTGSRTYEELLATVDTVLHVAWPVNFNMSVGSFASSVEGAVNLLNLATQSRAGRGPARYLFASSISAAMGSAPGTIIEAISDDPRDAQPMGYARSKWIVEQLCRIAGDAVGGGFEAVVLRIGQMIGDTVHGVWNETEAVPLMIRTAKTLGTLPDLSDRAVQWLGVDVAAEVIARLATAPPSLSATMRGATERCVPSKAELVHVVNPVATLYADVFAALARPENLGPSFRLEPPDAWVKRLAQSLEEYGVATNPTVKLLDYFRSVWGKGEVKRSGDDAFWFETTALSKALQRGAVDAQTGDVDGDGEGGQGEALELRKIDAEHVAKIVDAWRESGFLRRGDGGATEVATRP